MKCGETGYRGRIGIHELLVATPAVKSAISGRCGVKEIRDLAVHDGMRTLVQDGVMKILRGQTDFLQLLRVTVD
jgi:type II secretory ATPase GspE/PulE/Tfp pilus assembly ATPase PilB-like protein